MFGKPIANATLADIQRLIDGEVRESRHLEFKKEVPVSNEEQKRQRNETVGRPIDQRVAQGKGIGEFGRDKLLRELVALANQDGGVIVLGLDQTDEKPARAKKIEPIPHAFELEQSLRDAIVACIEPRLPFATVKAVPVGDEGAGVILIETQPSTLGPHWVTHARDGATVRREDRCDPLSMPEIHDMVLRNTRRFDEVRQRLAEARKQFESYFVDAGIEMCGRTIINHKTETLRASLHESRAMLFGLRVTVAPHQSLGIARLETVETIEPRGNIGCTPPIWAKAYPLMHPHTATGRRVLGGVVTNLDGQDIKRRASVDRDGHVENVVVCRQDVARHLPLFWLLAVTGSALGYYENLRKFAGAPSMPAEVDAEILVVGQCRIAISDHYGAHDGRPLEFRTPFRAATVSEFSDFHDYLTNLAGDFANAGGLSAEGFPRFTLELE